jgi:hypothetical protein
MSLDVHLNHSGFTPTSGDINVLTFDQYISDGFPAQPRQSQPTIVPAPVIDSLKAAGILAATLPEPPSLPEVATLLAAKITEMHRQQVADPTANRREMRLSYQNMNIGFLALLALAGSFPEQQESQ